MKLYSYCVVCFLLFASLGLVLPAQDGNKQKEKESVYAELAKVPEKSHQMKNPLTNDPDASAAGAVLFEEHCEECHGKQGIGGKKAPSLRAPEVQRATPGALFWILTNGVVRKKMPVWSKLPEPQRWQLVSYIKSLEHDYAEAKPASTP